MTMMIDGIDFHNIDIMKYWSFPSTWEQEKKKKTVNERVFSGEWYGALKRDGAFYKFTKDMDGNMELTGRSKSVSGDYLNKYDWVPHLHSFFESLPNGTCFLGELYLPSKEEAKSTTSIMNCLVNKAIKRQEKEPLRYYIFDVLAWGGKSYIDVPALVRFDQLNECWKTYGEDFYEWAEYFSGKELWHWLQMYLERGLEGIVITKGDAPYRPGKRPSKETLKIKKELQDTIDCIIIGANPPTKEYTGKEIESWEYWYNEQTNTKINKNMYKSYAEGAPVIPVTKNWYYGWAGSLKLGMYKDGKVVQVGNLSGISDDIKENWKDYVGQVAEVAAMEIMDTGGIRHPKFVQFRPDKDPKDCVYENLK